MVSTAKARWTYSGSALVASFTTRYGCSDSLYVVAWKGYGATFVIFPLLLGKL